MLSTENFIEKEQHRIFFWRIFRRIFLEDWLLKLIALAITLALWLGVTGGRTTGRFENIALNPRVSNDMEITNLSPKDVIIFVTGDKAKVNNLLSRDLVMSIDLTDVKAGDRIVQLAPESVNLELPSGVKLDRIEPNKINVRLEKVEEREIEVKPETEGSVADGFEIYSETVMPAKVRARGAESFVKSLDSIMTEKINIENQSADFIARQVGLNVVNPNVTVLDGIVDVAFKIGEKRAERIFVVPVKTERETKKAMVVLYGARSILENIHVEELKIELTKSETGEIVPQLVLPPELQDKIEVRKIKM
ncbi:MAG: CdaR family protein [Pyrinomonadaceae bacterium]